MSDASPRPETTTLRPGVYAGMLLLAVLFALLPYTLADAAFGGDVGAMTNYPWNFSPLLALCLYGGAFVRPRWLAVVLPVAAWVLQVGAVALYTGDPAGLTSGVMPWVVVSVALCGAIGWGLRDRRDGWHLAGCGLAAGALFFLVTNFGAWLGSPFYPQTPAGLLESYAAGLPFFRGTALGLLVFTPVLFAPSAARRPVTVVAAAPTHVA